MLRRLHVDVNIYYFFVKKIYDITYRFISEKISGVWLQDLLIMYI